MGMLPPRYLLRRDLFELLVQLGAGGSAGNCVEVRLFALVYVARVCYRSDTLLPLTQSLIELSQPLKSCGISLAQLLHMGWIRRPIPKPRKLSDGSLNQLIVIVAKGRFVARDAFKVRNALALGCQRSQLFLSRRYLRLWLRLLWLCRLLCLRRLLCFRLLRRFRLPLLLGITGQLNESFPLRLGVSFAPVR